jgi:paraquat-inducible protein B
MVDKKSNPPAGEAGEVVVKKTKISMVWIVPLVVVVLGATILYKTLRDAGIPIVLTFETAEGLEAGKTSIRYKDVEIGLVDAIRVSDDATHVVLDATLIRRAEMYLVETTRFWVVRPRVTLQGITGLGTLLSGAYINFDPGTEGKPVREFKGLEVPPMLELGSDVRQYILHAEELGSISVGSPIIYRGFIVGEVLSYRMMDDDTAVEIKFYVRDPHHEQVFTDSKFWDVSGMDVKAGADGLDIKIASVESLMIGGIAFETPKQFSRGVPAKEHTIFLLHRRHSDINYYENLKRKIRFYFDDSLRGLSEGAPIEYRGIKIGEVVDIAAEFDEETMEIRLPVTAEIEPERLTVLGADLDLSEKAAAERMSRFIELGIRGQLKSGSLISGALFIDLVMEPDTPIRLKSGPNPEIPEFPTIRSRGQQIMTSVQDVVAKLDHFMTKLNKLELEELVSSAAGAAEGIETLVKSEDLNGAVESAKELLEATQPVMKEIEQLVAEADTGLAEIRSGILDILERAETTMADLNALLAEGSPTQTDLRAMLQEITGMARSLRTLTDYLERHPEALIKGKP